MLSGKFSKLVTHAAGLILFAACATPVELTELPAPPPVEPVASVSASQAIPVDHLNVPQVGQGVDKGRDPLRVRQVSNVRAADQEFAFDAVAGDDPCAANPGEECAVASGALLAAEATKEPLVQARPETQFQALTGTVLDPESFDPERTIDEIGRQGNVRTQAAGAIGVDFLAPPPVDVPLPEENVPDIVLPNIGEIVTTIQIPPRN